MMTRRTILGAGAAVAAAACTGGFDMDRPFAPNRPTLQSIDALLVDETVAMPSRITASIRAARRVVPVIGIRLDAAAHSELMSLLHRSQTIAGITCGAALFCLERIGWDHGFRLIDRRERCAGELGDGPGREDVTEWLGGSRGLFAGAQPRGRAYRPSREDGTLHAWVMQKPAIHRFHRHYRAV